MRRFLVLALLALPSLAAPPDLVVVVSIDQFPQEYIERFEPWFGEGGFRRFMTEGAYYPDAWYPFATTYTCVGHATIGTGQLPRTHGIIANEWFDDDTRESVYCVEDPRARSSSGEEGSYSPLRLGADTLGDRLQERFDGSEVIGVGLKDRSGILMAGRKGDAAYWFEGGRFVSSSYYDYSTRVLEFNGSLEAFLRRHPRWEASGLIPEADLARVTYDPEALRKHKGGPSLPITIETVGDLTYTPFGNDLVLELARHVIEVEWMGRADGAPDILWVGLSSMDYLGHRYGPDSREVADAVVRLDRSLAAFVADLEERFGDRVTVALTADHGTQAIPEVARARGRDAGRVDIRERAQELEAGIARNLGLEVPEPSPLNRFILAVEQPSFYLNWDYVEALGLDGARVADAVAAALEEIPGVDDAFTAVELMSTAPPSTALERAARLSFRADRAGDVLAYLEPGWIYSGGTTGSTHGQAVEADQHVVLMLWGNGVPRGVFTDRAEIQQLARTLGALLGVDAGTPGGAVLPGW
ncbi:MAG: alkaline phosphatase family protein [Thermoanaerobaculia bacterium]